MNYKFNLQPWREAVRQQQKKNFISTTVFLLLLTFGFIGANYYIEQSYIDDQQETKTFLETEIAQLESAEQEVKDTKEIIEEINKQIAAIESLQAQRGIALQLLDYIANKTPENVFIDHMTFDGEQLVIEGVAENDRGVAEFMRVLQANHLLNVAVLHGIQSAESSERYEVPQDSETKSFTVAVDLNSIEGETTDEVR